MSHIHIRQHMTVIDACCTQIKTAPGNELIRNTLQIIYYYFLSQTPLRILRPAHEHES
jgi:hypothetical protein